MVKNMHDWYEKNYWRAGFKSRLYDLLTPESYFESMRQTVALIPDKKGQVIWDAGCGSGVLLEFLEDAFKREGIYVGSDMLAAGLEQMRRRAKELGVFDQVSCLQNDLSEPSLFKENSVDVVVAHFSIYTLRDNDKRQQALKNMCHVLKPGGLLIVTCPSKNYDAVKIIKESCELLRVRRGLLQTMIKRMFFYPFTKWLGLNFIQNQLESGQWKAYTPEGLAEELQQAGLKIGSLKALYAGGAYLMCGRKMG